MKKISLLSIVFSSLMFANIYKKENNNINIENIKEEVTKTFKTIAKKLSLYKNNKTLYITKDEKLNDIYIGIEEIEMLKKENLIQTKEFLIFYYFPKAKAIQVFTLNQFRIIQNKKPFIYIDEKLQKLFKVYQHIVHDYQTYLEHEKMAQLKILTNKVLKKLNNNNGIIFLNKDKKETLLIFIDPHCPFCKQRINKHFLNKLAKKYNIGLILLPLVSLDKNNNVDIKKSLHPNSFDISIQILNELNNHKYSFNEKINKIKKLMNTEKIKLENSKMTNNNKKKILKNYKDFLETNLITGTPTILILDRNQTKILFNKFQ